MKEAPAITGKLNASGSSSGALFGASFLFLMQGMLWWPFQGLTWSIPDLIILTGSALLAAASLFAIWFPLVASIIGGGIYGAFLSRLLMLTQSKLPLVMWILLATAGILLVIAIFQGLKSAAFPRQSQKSRREAARN